MLINLFQPSVAFHKENSNLICIANQNTGFYMKSNVGLKWLKQCHYHCQSDVYTLTDVKTISKKIKVHSKTCYVYNEWYL